MSIFETKQIRISTGVTDNDTLTTKGYVDDKVATVDTWNEVMHLGNTFTVADTENLSATITQNDTTNNPAALIIANTGSGNDITLPNSSYIKNGSLVLGGDVGLTGTRITKGWFTDLESTNMPTVGGTSINANAVLDLTSAEVAQLAKIGTTTIETTQWDILGLANQGIATTNSVTFAQVTVDNITINSNKISTSSQNLTIEAPSNFLYAKGAAVLIQATAGGSYVVINEDAQNADFRVEGGSITNLFFLDASTDRIGIATSTPSVLFDVNGAGKFTALTVDNLVLNANTLSSTSGNINITPDNPADHIIINGHWDFDGKTLVAISDSDTTLTAYAGKNITIEGVTFDGGVVASITDLTVDNLNLNGNTLSSTSGDVNVTSVAGITLTGADNNDIIFAAGLNGKIAIDNVRIYSSAIETSAGDLKLISASNTVLIGDQAAGVDYILRFNGETNNADIKYWEDEDYFAFNAYITQPGIFAEIYVADASTAQSIATGVGYTKSTAFTTDGQSSNCTAAAASDKITITQTGKYRVSGSCSATAGKANLTWRGAAFLNNVEQSQVHWKRKMTTTTDSGDMSFTGFVDVTSAPWDLDFRLRHDDGGNQNFTIEYANLNVEYVGAT